MSKSKQIEGQLDFFALLNSDEDEGSISKNSMDEVFSFSECSKCWCRDCKHNELNEGVLRDFGGEKKPCPACNFCIDNDEPEICVIGSSKNGCKLRAEEEGIGPEI